MKTATYDNKPPGQVIYNADHSVTSVLFPAVSYTQ